MSGVAGADRVKSRQDFQQFLRSYQDLIKQFPGFVSLKPSGSYNSNLEKQDFGDIDLIVQIISDKDKATVKKELQAFFTRQPETVIVPFSSDKHAGKRSYNAGELVSVRYHDDTLGYSAQIDNIVALDQSEATFKQEFLDMPAEKQGLILGLVKISTIETDPQRLFKSLGISAPPLNQDNQEYEFNLSSIEIQLRLVTYKPGTYEQLDRKVVWTSRDFNDLNKILYQYDLSADFDDLLKQAKINIRNPRSNNRMQGVFNSMITVKSGEVGTAKGAGKLAASQKVAQTFKESRSLLRSLIETDRGHKVVFAFVRFQPPTIGHELLINTVKQEAEKNGCPYVIFVSRKQGLTSAPRLRDPLSIDQKMEYLHKMFPGVNFVAAGDDTRTPIEAAKILNQKYTDIILVAGGDRAGLKDQLEKFNGVNYNFNSISFVSAGNRDPDSDEVSGVSGTDVRTAAKNNDFATFRKNLPSNTDDTTAHKLMKDLQVGMSPVPRKQPVKAKKGVAETPIAGPNDNPTIYGHQGANPSELKTRIMRAKGQIKDLSQRSDTDSLLGWESIARDFPELAMNIEQIRHAIEELAKKRKKGGISSRGIDPHIGEQGVAVAEESRINNGVPIGEAVENIMSALIDKIIVNEAVKKR